MNDLSADVVVTGAGTAGVHVAWRLALAGWSVVLVEKRNRAELGHDWWDGVTRDVFSEVGLPLPEPPERMNDSGRSKICPPGDLPPIDAEPNPDVFIVDRKLLIQRQVRLAEDAGVKFVFGETVREPIAEAETVAGVVVAAEDGTSYEIRSRFTIDASGIAGVLRGKLSRFGFIEKVDVEDTLYCYREIRKRPSESNETRYMFGDRDIRWITREQDGLADFFAGVIGAKSGLSPKTLVDEMVRDDPSCGEVVRGGHGGLIPLRHCIDSFVAPGFMVVGDAACQCNPLNGCGIVSSLRAATIAARVASDALEKGDVSTAAMWKYNAEYKRNWGGNFAFLHALRKFFVLEPTRNLEKLFRYGVISLGQLRGPVNTGGMIGTPQVVGLLRLAEKPAFLVRLLIAVSTAKSVSEHFEKYPRRYSKHSFSRWVKKKNRLLGRIDGLYK